MKPECHVVRLWCARCSRHATSVVTGEKRIDSQSLTSVLTCERHLRSVVASFHGGSASVARVPRRVCADVIEVINARADRPVGN
jgi:hypothetical protein